MSKFTFYYGCMGSGKSLDLIRTAYNYKERGLKVRVFKPRMDTREGSDKCIIKTRVGLTLDAEWLDEGPNSIRYNFVVKMGKGDEKPDIILIDEAQFLSKQTIKMLKKASIMTGIPYIFYGLKTDFQGNLFEGTAALMSYSEKISELVTMCSCGKLARQNARVVNGKIVRDGEQVAIEGETKYIALCNACYMTKEEI